MDPKSGVGEYSKVSGSFGWAPQMGNGNDILSRVSTVQRPIIIIGCGTGGKQGEEEVEEAAREATSSATKNSK